MIEEYRYVSPEDLNFPELLKIRSKALGRSERKGLYIFEKHSLNNDVLRVAGVGSRVFNRRDYDINEINKVIRFLESFFVQYRDAKFDRPLITVSGMCYGGDGLIHHVSLENNVPTTGVNPGPLNRPHPLDNQGRLFERIYNQRTPNGLVISEYAPVKPDQHWSPKYFDRNKVTAGISDVVLAYGIINIGSGAMNTVELARKADVPTYFIDGTVNSTVANQMLALGCQKIQQPEELIEIINRMKENS